MLIAVVTKLQLLPTYTLWLICLWLLSYHFYATSYETGLLYYTSYTIPLLCKQIQIRLDNY